MSDPASKYQLKISISMSKEGEDLAQDPWVMDNTYNDLDYGNLVIIQTVLVDSIGKSLTGLGIAQADALGFKVREVLEQLQAANSIKTKTKSGGN